MFKVFLLTASRLRPQGELRRDKSDIEFQSLKNSQISTTLMNMNAAEIIEEIQRLSEDEKGKVVEFVRHQPNAETLEAMREPVEEGRSFKSAAELFASIEAEDEC